jgi:hypothetical protein
MAARGRQKKPNATKSMKELTKLEKEAEARSEKRRANIARNKAAGNAGLSSQRLTRMEAEAERKAADRRAARNKPSTVTADPTERINKPNTKTSSAMTRAKEIAKKAVPAGRVIGRFAGPVGLAAGAIEVLSALPDSVKKSGLTGGGRMDRGKKNKTKVGTGSSGPSTRQSNKALQIHQKHQALQIHQKHQALQIHQKHQALQIHQKHQALQIHQKHQAPQLAKVNHVLLLKRRV